MMSLCTPLLNLFVFVEVSQQSWIRNLFQNNIGLVSTAVLILSGASKKHYKYLNYLLSYHY